MTGNNTAIAAALFKSLPYNVLTDFHSVSTAAFFDLLIVTRAGSPLKTVQDIIDAARKNPGKLNIGTITPGSTQNLAADLFVSTAGINAAIVPFRASPDMAGAVLRGDVDVAFEFYAAINGLLIEKKIVGAGLDRPGKDRLPARRADRRSKAACKDFEVQSWNGLSVPAATPASVVATLNAAMKEVIPTPDGSGPGETDGHGHALEHARRHDRRHEGRYRQMGRGDRKSRHPQARLSPTTEHVTDRPSPGGREAPMYGPTPKPRESPQGTVP